MDAIALLSTLAPTVEAAHAGVACEFSMGQAFGDEFEAEKPASKELQRQSGPVLLANSPIPFAFRLETERSSSPLLDTELHISGSTPLSSEHAASQDLPAEEIGVSDNRLEFQPEVYPANAAATSDIGRKDVPEGYGQAANEPTASTVSRWLAISAIAGEPGMMRETRPVSEKPAQSLFAEGPTARQAGNSEGSMERAPPAIESAAKGVGPTMPQGSSSAAEDRAVIMVTDGVHPPPSAPKMTAELSGRPLLPDGALNIVSPDRPTAQAGTEATPPYKGKDDSRKIDLGHATADPNDKPQSSEPDLDVGAMVAPEREALETPALREISGRADRSGESVNDTRPRFFAPTAPAPQEAPRLLLRQDGEAMELSLDDNDLGRLELKIQETPHGVRVEVDSNRADSLDAARRHAADLQRDLRQQGYGEVSFHFGGDKKQDRRNPLKSDASESQFAVMIETAPQKGLAGEDRLDLRM